MNQPFAFSQELLIFNLSIKGQKMKEDTLVVYYGVLFPLSENLFFCSCLSTCLRLVFFSPSSWFTKWEIFSGGLEILVTHTHKTWIIIITFKKEKKSTSHGKHNVYVKPLSKEIKGKNLWVKLKYILGS